MPDSTPSKERGAQVATKTEPRSRTLENKAGKWCATGAGKTDHYAPGCPSKEAQPTGGDQGPRQSAEQMLMPGIANGEFDDDKIWAFQFFQAADSEVMANRQTGRRIPDTWIFS
jgi:hypothetical protein